MMNDWQMPPCKITTRIADVLPGLIRRGARLPRLGGVVGRLLPIAIAALALLAPPALAVDSEPGGAGPGRPDGNPSRFNEPCIRNEAR